MITFLDSVIQLLGIYPKEFRHARSVSKNVDENKGILFVAVQVETTEISQVGACFVTSWCVNIVGCHGNFTLKMHFELHRLSRPSLLPELQVNRHSSPKLPQRLQLVLLYGAASPPPIYSQGNTEKTYMYQKLIWHKSQRLLLVPGTTSSGLHYLSDLM